MPIVNILFSWFFRTALFYSDSRLFFNQHILHANVLNLQFCSTMFKSRYSSFQPSLRTIQTNQKLNGTETHFNACCRLSDFSNNKTRPYGINFRLNAFHFMVLKIKSLQLILYCSAVFIYLLSLQTNTPFVLFDLFITNKTYKENGSPIYCWCFNWFSLLLDVSIGRVTYKRK